MKTDIELISIGSELLSGRTLNSHAQTLGAALSSIGLRLSRDTTIPDETETIQSALREAFRRVDIAVVSGGLGPTSDDITRDALAGLFDCRTVMSPAGLEALHKRYAERSRAVTPAAERQALILEGAEMLINSAGAAPGERLELPENKTLFVLPGPPNEFSTILEEHMIPWLRGQFSDAVPLEVRVLTTADLSESDIVTRLEADGFQSPGVSVGFYPGGGKVEICLSAPKEHLQLLKKAESTIRKLLRDKLVAD